MSSLSTAREISASQIIYVVKNQNINTNYLFIILLHFESSSNSHRFLEKEMGTYFDF